MAPARVWIAVALACGCKGESAGQPSKPVIAPPVTAPPVTAPAAASAFAKTFAAELVGTITPVAPGAGDYAMALAMTFETFVTMELRISEQRTGGLQLALARDGTAHACAGVIRHHVSAGQYHYERDPAKRQHSERTDSQLRVLAGTWQVVDGIAVIRLDRSAGATCDASKAIAIAGVPVTELRCIAVTGSDRVPAGSLACEVSEPGQLLDLGMPMTEANRASHAGGPHHAPVGRDLVLGVPGVAVEVTETRRMQLPAITFRAAATPLVETDYVKPR